MANTKVTSSLIADNAIGIDQLNVSDGTNGQVLTTNGSGTLSFATVSGYTDSDVESYLNTSTIYTDPTNDRLGIGTSVPSYKLSLQDNSTSAYPLVLENGNIGTVGVHTGIRFGYSGNTYQKGAIIFEGQDASGRGKMYFAMEGTADNSNADETDAKLTIDYSGNVGIGTDSPTVPLQINHGSSSVGLYTLGGYNYQAKFESSDAEAAIVIEDSNSTTDGNRIGVITDDMTFITAGSERMRIDSAGDVRLVGGHQMTNALSWWNSTNYELASIENASHPSYNDSGGLVFKTAKTSSGGMAEAMRIDSQGFVGMGTNNPENKLHLMLPTGQNGDILRLSRSSGSYSFKVGVDGNSSYYVSNLSSTKIIDANYQGWVTHPQQPHIVFSPRYSGGSGFANYHHEDTTYSRGTLSSTTVAGYARVTVPTAGLYLVTFYSIGNNENSVRRDMAIAVNGGNVATALTEYNTNGFKYRCMTITLDLAANDYLTFSNDNWYDAASGSVTTWRKVSITLIG